MASRRFDWISSSRGDPARLAGLQEKMDRFYRRPEAREAYQTYIDKREVESFDHPFERQVAEYLVRARPVSALEVGCGNGRFFRTLARAGFAGRYVGTEVAGWIVQGCRRRHPDAGWVAATAYQIPVADGSFDVCFSYGVIESLVYPERALAEMLRVLKRGGRLVLLFPDFVESGRFGSQLTGLSPGRAMKKLERGRWIDAAVTYYDQKLRLPRALRRSRDRIGPFPINLAPVALDHPADTAPDYDAVYLSSKADIAEWASARGLAVDFPLGRRLPRSLRARSWAFLVIRAS
jgi:SAM-dependent methyltransferase